MKTRIDADTVPAFADAVTRVARHLPTRPSQPVLAGALLRAHDGRLDVCGFDYDVSVVCSVPTTGGEDGAALVSGQMLAAFAKALPGKPLDIAVNGSRLELACGAARFGLPTMPVEDYPTLPEMPESTGTVDAAAFADAVARVANAASRDTDNLIGLTGVRIESSHDTLTLIATDRHRVVVQEIPFQVTGPGGVTSLVSAPILAAVAKTLDGRGAITVAASEPVPGAGLIGFAGDGAQVTSRLLDGRGYPDVRKVFAPRNDTHEAWVAVADLIAVVKGVAPVVDRKTQPVALRFESDGPEGLCAAASDEDNSASNRIDVAYAGPSVVIGVRPLYLLDELAALRGSHARLRLIGPKAPIFINGCDGVGGPVDPARQFVVMPQRLPQVAGPA